MPPARALADPQELQQDLQLLRPWREPLTPRRLLRDGVGSVMLHALGIVLLLSMPEGERPKAAPVIHQDLTKAVHIVLPKFYEPTQKAPNTGKVTRELDVRSLKPAPQTKAPQSLPPAPAPGPLVQTPPTPAPAPVIEPPKIQASAAPPAPVATNAPTAAPPPPPPTPAERPKLAFETVESASIRNTPNPDSAVPLPKTKLEDIAHSAAPGGGGTIVGDVGADARVLPGAIQAPSAGRSGSNLQLMSDPKGVDFKPYLVQVLAAVRRNWLAIMPESARLGRPGRVLVQFSIDRTGAIPKLVIAEGAGTDAFDRAAVAAISASVPLPPLPPDYKGDQIRLQFAFSYNMPRR
jgi:TonB family protein